MKLLVVLLFSQALAAGNVKIVSPRDAASQISEVSIVDSRSPSDFREGHLPQSRRMDWKDWTEEKPNFWNYLFGDSAKWGKVLSNPSDLSERLSALGLRHDRPILVVGKPHEWGEEGRISWNLLYWGANEVRLLDGGYPAWAKAGLPLSRGDEAELPRGNFVVTLQPARRALIPDVQAAQGKARLLDTRAEDEFKGKTMSGQKRGGKIADARLVPVLSLYTPEGTYVGKEELTRLTGAPENAIAYCVGGVRSALLALLLEARLGKLTRNYDGSIWEWSADESLPLN